MRIVCVQNSDSATTTLDMPHSASGTNRPVSELSSQLYRRVRRAFGLRNLKRTTIPLGKVRNKLTCNNLLTGFADQRSLLCRRKVEAKQTKTKNLVYCPQNERKKIQQKNKDSIKFIEVLQILCSFLSLCLSKCNSVQIKENFYDASGTYPPSELPMRAKYGEFLSYSKRKKNRFYRAACAIWQI